MVPATETDHIFHFVSPYFQYKLKIAGTPGSAPVQSGCDKSCDLRWPMASVSCVWGHVWKGWSVPISGSGSADR